MGWDDEEAYTIIDLYAQECEQAPTVEAVKLLQYNMLLDFTQRVAREKLPPHLSPEIAQCVQFLRGHLFRNSRHRRGRRMGGKKQGLAYEEVQGGDGAEFWGVSILPANPGGQTPAAVHGHQSQRNRGELGFSSQAYFHSFFKKAVGMTPSEFRKQLKRRKGEGRVDTLLFVNLKTSRPKTPENRL